jgi:hypothetical protein
MTKYGYMVTVFGVLNLAIYFNKNETNICIMCLYGIKC